jgi:hypothetical protein
MSWQQEREKAKLERDQRRMARVLAAPIARGESYEQAGLLSQHIASLALAIEALEGLLEDRGILFDDEIMARMKVLAERKREQAQAAAAAVEAAPSLIEVAH